VTEVKLPAILTSTRPALLALTEALGVPRSVLASDDSIETAWNTLPSLLKKIPPNLRTDGLARMCVAVASGLFDSAINYVWNSAVIELREKVKRFGLPVVAQVKGKNFDEAALIDLKDADLLNLALELNLITEEGFFFLDQCRDIRNNFSAAHPAVGTIDEHELTSFINRCSKFALGNENNPIGVDVQGFIKAVKGVKFLEAQTGEWVDRLNKTHQAQREMLIGVLHGIYCDPASSEESRLNALAISSVFAKTFTPTTKSLLIDRHSEYLAKGNDKQHKASQQYFEKLELLELLGDSERHAMISTACKNLFSVHQSFNNFYNEPPFAERLLELASQGAVPDTSKDELVTTVLTCAVGNQYGVSNAAIPSYEKIIKGFSQKEIAIFLELPTTKTVVAQRIKSYTRCKNAFKNMVTLIDAESVPTKMKNAYEQWLTK
jgi:hypothetical protein